MASPSTCRNCGAVLTDDARDGFCPKCLFRLADAGTLRVNPPDEVELGTAIGRYKLLEKIGEGGFGAVYVAEQREPVKRRVALKIIKLGMDTRQVIARFEAERQALALMDHPNIARVFDGDATETGRPYFVMELVRGIRITDYCDQNNLSTEQRLRLFMQICHAIQHAHQKGIIHRDIKASNILVTLVDGQPVPKVIDFGIAKATQGQLTDKTVYTQLHQFIGTPAYMSPEQAMLSGVDVDTRSDIYSLGVLLYELLTGCTPFDPKTLRAAGLDEMRRMIREEEPPRPSTRISTLDETERTTVAKHRQAEPTTLSRLVRGDLDWIVMKCLEKERGRRYETANALARDIELHLNQEPVSAAAPSTIYRFQKFVRRNKLIFAAGTAVALAVLIGSAFSAWQAIRANRALSELRAAAPALAEQARALVAQERFDEAIERLDYAAKLRPDVAEYLVAKANLLQANLKLAEAVQVYRRALKLKPGLPSALTNADLCDKLLVAKRDAQGQLTRESLAELHLAMQRENRPAAELLPVARLLGKENEVLLQAWLARLRDLPIPPDKPLTERLTMREDGLLGLDLSGTKLRNLEALAGAPLGRLNLSNVLAVADLAPLRGMRLSELEVSGTAVKDLSPLSGMSSLRRLYLSRTKVTDLSPLAGLRLVRLELEITMVSDLSPLKGMPLEWLAVNNTHVISLSALTGMPLKWLEANAVPVLDFTPLVGVPLEALSLQQTRVRDLGFVRGMPLKLLMLYGCEEVRNLSVLSDIPTLETLLLPGDYRTFPPEEVKAIAALKTHPHLKQIAADFMRGSSSDTLQSKDLFWRDWAMEESVVEPLRTLGLDPTLTKLVDGTYKLDLSGASLTNVPPIPKDFPLSRLWLSNSKVRDLSGVGGLRLRALSLWGSSVEDLGPLEGMPLEWLSLGGPNMTITNFTPLVGLPLQSLYTDTMRGRLDISVLAKIPTLGNLTLPALAQNVEALKNHPGIKRLSFTYDSTLNRAAQTAEEFWQEWDQQQKSRAALGFKPYSDRSQAGTNLLDLARFYNENLSRFGYTNPKQNLQDSTPATNAIGLPPGIGTLAGTEFDVEGVVGMPQNRSTSVAGIPIHRKFARLHVLHGTGWSEPDGTKIGAYILHYPDGRQSELPIRYGEDVRDWCQGSDPKDATRAVIAWSGPNPTDAGGRLRLFKRTWANPRPEVEVESIDFTSTMTQCAPFLVALTLE